MTRRLLLSDLEKVVRSKGGKLLSTVYKNQKQPLRVRCKDGFEWNSSGDKIMRGYWCPHCAGMVRLTLNEMKKLAGSRGGKCLSKKYVNSETKMKWQCSKGHVWMAVSGNVKSGTWCKICAGKQKDTIQAMRDLARIRGGKCLSKEYVSRNQKLEWECALKHRWSAAPNNVKLNESWCPECKSFLRERLCRTIFETMFQAKFPPMWPKWLLNSRGERMELDGYSEELKLAFEHHGKQHYFTNNMTMKTEKSLSLRKGDDLRKKELCKKNGVHLVVIPYDLKLKKIPDFVRDQCEGKVLVKNQKVQIEDINFRKTYSKSPIFDLNKIAMDRGGALLSQEYFGIDEPLKWKCQFGHVWLAAPNNIKNMKQWCPKCGRKNAGDKQRLSIDEMRKIAERRGGKCLSSKYININTKLKWQCRQKHTWMAVPQHVKNNGAWCPKCAGKKR